MSDIIIVIAIVPIVSTERDGLQYSNVRRKIDKGRVLLRCVRETRGREMRAVTRIRFFSKAFD